MSEVKIKFPSTEEVYNRRKEIEKNNKERSEKIRKKSIEQDSKILIDIITQDYDDLSKKGYTELKGRFGQSTCWYLIEYLLENNSEYVIYKNRVYTREKYEKEQKLKSRCIIS
jgi:hypothetical protein